METFRFLDPSVSKINERDGRRRPASFSNLKESNLKKESEDSNRNPESTYRLVDFASFSSYFSIFFLYTSWFIGGLVLWSIAKFRKTRRKLRNALSNVDAPGPLLSDRSVRRVASFCQQQRVHWNSIKSKLRSTDLGLEIHLFTYIHISKGFSNGRYIGN